MSGSLPPVFPVFTRRHFAGLSLGACLAGLAGCGGGGDAAEAAPSGMPLRDLEVPDVAHKALASTQPGLIAQAPLVIAGPGFDSLQVKAVAALADGGFAVAWATARATDATAPRQLRVQRFTAAGERAGDALLLPVAVKDEQAAVAVLRDGGVIVVWRESVPGQPYALVLSLMRQRFDPAGQPLAGPEVVASLVQDRYSPNARSLEQPRLDSWPDGSHVVAWGEVTFLRGFPGLAVILRARRYHANGWPVGEPVVVGGSANTRDFSLQAWEVQGGYAVSNVARPVGPFFQVIRLFDVWNPIDPARFEGLLEGSFIVPIGICGSLLFAARADAHCPQLVRWDRQLFNWEGQALGPAVPLPRRPGQIVPLRQLGQFLELTGAARPNTFMAQRMDKYGALIEAPFELPAGSYAATLEGSLVAAWVSVSKTGNYALLVQRFTDPRGGRDLVA